MEAMGAKLDWNQPTSAATVYLPGVTLTITSGSPMAMVNSGEVALPVVPTIRDGALFVPLRAIADICNIPIGWDSTTSTVTLYTNAKPERETVHQISLLKTVTTEHVEISAPLYDNILSTNIGR